jgi:membrane associated rhomboid family serine protease
MLEDRYYMRGPSFGVRRSATVILLIVNAVVFIGQLVFTRFSDFPVNHYFALSLWGLKHGYVWQLLTFQFMHGGWLHLLINCWVIYVFGRELEETLGVKRFLTLYLSSGIIGGLVQALAGLLIGGAFARPVVGASAGGFGLVAAFATLYPERPLMLLLFFIIPINMRAKFLLLFSGLAAALGIIFPGDGIAHAAHLGGMLTGMAYIRYASQWELRWPRWRWHRPPARRPLVKVHSGSGSWAKTARTHELPADEFLSREVDPILDKISAQGIQSLTERERKILEAAREKMAKR